MKFLFAAGAFAALILATPARAAPASDALVKCLGDATGTADRRVLVRWIYSVMTVHPDLADLVAMPPERREQLEKDAGVVMERLIAHDCAAEVKTALREDGTNGFGKAFEALGTMAMTDFVAQRDVQRAAEGVGARIDQKRVLEAWKVK